MNCLEIQTRLAEDLAVREEWGVAAHLNRCEKCRGVLEDLLELETLSRSLSGRFRVPQSFQSEVLARAEETRARRSRRFRWGVALLMFVCLSGTGLISSGVFPGLNTGFGNEESLSADGLAGNSESKREERPVFVDVWVEGDEAEAGEMILRLPSVIEIHRSKVQEDFYINNVSH